MRALLWLLPLLLVSGLLLFPACAEKTVKAKPIPIVFQLSNADNKAQLERRVNEFTKRGFVATVKAEPAKVSGDYLKALSDKGFEIMGEVAVEPKNTYEQQLGKTLEAKKAIETYTGKPVLGWSASGSRFNRGDEYTANVLDAIGARWQHISARYEKMPCYALEPYQAPGHKFVIVNVQSRCVYNITGDPFNQDNMAMSGSN